MAEKTSPWHQALLSYAGLKASVSQLVSQQKIPLIKKFLKFYSHLKAFWVDLKTWFYLTNTAILLNGRIEAGFQRNFCHRPCPQLRGPYYTVLQYCMIYMQLSKILFGVVIMCDACFTVEKLQIYCTIQKMNRFPFKKQNLFCNTADQFVFILCKLIE